MSRTSTVSVNGGVITKHASMASLLPTPCWDGRSLYLLHWSRSRAERVAWLLLELSELYPLESTGRTLPTFEIMQCPDGPEFRTVKPEWVRSLNPNAKAPILVDYGAATSTLGGAGTAALSPDLPEGYRRALCNVPDKQPIVMIESIGMTTYLCQRYDSANKLGISGRMTASPTSYKSFTVERRLSKYMMVSAYCAGTADNLVMKSSIFQQTYMRRSGNTALFNQNVTEEQREVSRQSYVEVVAPFFESQMEGSGPYFFGEEFHAIDVLVGFSIGFVALGYPESFFSQEGKAPSLESFEALGTTPSADIQWKFPRCVTLARLAAFGTPSLARSRCSSFMTPS
jgi:glutathione S-transferase